jgi:hypothetical protein
MKLIVDSRNLGKELNKGKILFYAMQQSIPPIAPIFTNTNQLTPCRKVLPEMLTGPLLTMSFPILWNPHVHVRIHNCSSAVCIMYQINPIHANHPIF